MNRKSLYEIVGDYSMRASRRNDSPDNIRAGMQVIGNRQNVLSDEQTQELVPESACVLVVRKDGMILSVSRGNNIQDLNIPGGRIEPGESPEDAARRELWEETGLFCAELLEIYRTRSRTKVVVIYKAKDFHGKIRGSAEGKAMWAPPSKLLDGTFGETFSRLVKLGFV